MGDRDGTTEGESVPTRQGRRRRRGFVALARLLGAGAAVVLAAFVALPVGDASAQSCQLGTNDCWYDHMGLVLPPAGVSDPSADLLFEQLYWVVPSAPSPYLLDCTNNRLYLPYLRMQNAYGDAGLRYDVTFRYPNGSTTVSSGNNIGNVKNLDIFNDFGRWVQYEPDLVHFRELPYIQISAPAGVSWSAVWTSVDYDAQHLFPTVWQMTATNSQGTTSCPMPVRRNLVPFGDIALSVVDGHRYGMLGYAIDPDTGASPPLRVRMEGVDSREFTWNHTWADLPARTGWNSTQSLVYLAVLPSGTRTVCLDAFDTGSGLWIPVSCRSVTVK